VIDALHYEFMRHAVVAGVLASVVCGIIGTLVVVNRIVFISGGIAHAAYGGIGLAVFMGWPFLPTTLAFTVAIGWGMAAVSLRARHRADTVIGVIWALGMAAGIILLDLTPGYNVNLMSFLFGSILTVPADDLRAMAALTLGIAALVGLLYQPLLAMSYDEEFARIRGVPVTPLYFVLIGTLAVAVVMVIQVVGLILVIALLTIPPFIVERYCRSLATMMAVSVALGVAFTLVGLWASYALNLTSGATIILVAGLGFVVARLLEALLGRRARRAAAPAAGPDRGDA
jgi:zinc transport system permease protein